MFVFASATFRFARIVVWFMLAAFVFVRHQNRTGRAIVRARLAGGAVVVMVAVLTMAMQLLAVRAGGERWFGRCWRPAMPCPHIQDIQCAPIYVHFVIWLVQFVCIGLRFPYVGDVEQR